MLIARHRNTSPVTVLYFSAIFLVLGSLCLNSLFSSPIFFGIGLVLILFFLFIYYQKNITPEDYLLLILTLSFFDYSSSRGGLWNYVNFLFLTGLLISRRWKPVLSPRVSVLLPLFIFLNLIGLIFINPGTTEEKILFLIVFLSFILMFLFASNISFTIQFFIKFSKVLLLISVYQLFICLNQRFEFVNTIMPFFPIQTSLEDYDLRELGLGVNKVRNWGSIGNFEFFAEINSMIFVFYFSCFGFYKSIRRSPLYSTCLCIICISLLNVILSGTRSSLLLMVLFTFILGIIKIRHLFSNRKTLFYLIGTLFFVFLLVPSLIRLLGLETLVLRMSLLNTSEINISTGEGMNREGTYNLAFDRINEETLLIGNGYTFGTVYTKIMKGGHISNFGDFHNLYLAAPFFYGWIGSLILVILFIKPLVIMFIKTNFLWISFISMWTIFLINEYKIQFIRDPHYTMLIWILLGLTYSFIGNPQVTKK